MLEIVVGIVLLTAGALGYAAVTASLVRSSLVDARRARAGDLIDSQRETILREGCTRAQSGSSNRFGMALEWTVGPPGGATRAVAVRLSRPGAAGIQTDSVSGVLPCV